MSNPTAPLSERTPEDIAEYVDDHLIMALNGADHLSSDRQTAEDYIRDRLVALADTYPTTAALATEESRRRMDRLRRAIFPERKP